MKICVLSRSGRGGQDNPYVFHLGQRRPSSTRTIKQRQGGSSHSLTMATTGRRRFVLRHDPTTGDWQLAAAYGGGSQPAATVRL